ncbi:MAG: M28 family peptidase [Balneolaceae bacterium]
MKKLLFITLPVLLILITGCQSPADRAAENITRKSLLEPIEYLSSDKFEGRAPATRGEELTVSYLTQTLKETGIEPGMPDGSYTQEFPLLGQQVDGESARLRFRRGGRVVAEPAYRTGFMAWPASEQENVQIRNAEVVYVGYGIQAPEYDWDDYKDVDVEGKILLFKNDDPSYDPDIFEGDARLYYGRWSYKFEKAAEMGALGAIIIHTGPTAGYPWEVVSNSWGRERFSLKSGTGENHQFPEFNSWVTEEYSARIFDLAGLDFIELLEAADSRDFRPVSLENVTVDVQLSAVYRDMSSRNVIGKIEGNDADVNDEYLILSAHYDHLGISTPVDGDSVNNGARDNAAGVSAVLEIGKALKEVESDMRRSVLLTFVGAEEMGLLGSQYWANNPTVHPGKVTANINLDGMQVYGKTRDVVLVGYGRNTITDVIRQLAEQKGRVVKPDQQPQQGYFYRSDHYSFASVGIPAIFPRAGRDYMDKPDHWNAVVDSVDAANYHSVSDEINEYWDLTGMERDVRLFFRSSFQILNNDELMEWYPGDEFEATRSRMLLEANESYSN